MQDFFKNKKTSDILFHEIMKCSRLLMASSHRFRGFEGRHQRHHHHCGHGHFGGHMEHMGRCFGEHRTHDIQKIGQGRLLSFLLEKDGISQKELSDLLRIAPASVSELINKLENGGYIEKRQNESDKRITNIFLTEGGHFFAQKMEEERTEFTSDIFTALSEDEQKQLLTLLQKLIYSLSNTSNDIDSESQCYNEDDINTEE